MNLNSGQHRALKLMNERTLLLLLCKKRRSLRDLSKETRLSVSGVTTLMKELYEAASVLLPGNTSAQIGSIASMS